MSTLLRIFSLLTLLASILLLASLSLEVLYSRAFAEFSELYTWAMLVVCVIAHMAQPWKAKNILAV